MTIAELCVKRPVFAVMLIGFLVVMGIFSFKDLGVDLFPKSDPATVTVAVQLPGAGPEEITTQVILPLEEAISSVSGLDEMASKATEGIAQISCKFVLERDTESAAQDIREKVAGSLRSLPPNILPPVIQKVDPDQDPVLVLVVAGDRTMRETTEIADKEVKRPLETVDGVGEVSLSGGRERQIRIFADAEKMEAYGITINQVARAVQSENVEVPGGKVSRGEIEYNVRTIGRIRAAEQFENIIVANVNGSPIRMKDLGRVEDSYPEPTTWNMVEDRSGIPHENVALSVRRQSGTNTVQVIAGVKKKLAELQKTLPPGVSVQIIRDNAIFINASVKALEEHLLLGSLLASLVVLFFIGDFRSVLIAALAIPTSIVATFTLLKAMDFTLNNMTLLALTLAVGIVIDDAIVVLENIVRWIEEKHFDPKRAAIEATKEITLAVLATTLSLVIIFVPIAFMTGYARRFVNEFGWTMAVSVMVSMLVAFTLTPMLSSLLLKRRETGGGEAVGEQARPAMHGHSSIGARFFGRLDAIYGRALEWALDHRAIVVLAAVGVFLFTFPLNSKIGRDFIPADDQNEMQVMLDTPVGSSVEGTARITTEMAHRIVRLRGVEFVNPNMFERSNHIHMYVRLKDISQRDYSDYDVAADIRNALTDFKAANIRIAMPQPLGGSGDVGGGIRPMILGPDFYKTVDIAERSVENMKTLPGLLDAYVDVTVNSPEFQVEIDRQRASDLGVRASDVASAVRLMISGTDQISTYKEGDEQYDVTMQLLPEQQKNPEILNRLMIPSSKVGQVRLENVATINRGYSPMKIDRYNRQFAVTLGANNAPDFPLDQAVRAIGAEIRKAGLPTGYTLKFTGSAKQLDETTYNLIIAFLLASIFMYMVLAAQFESFLHPFAIMLSLPLSIPFALFSLWITHRTLNLWSALGVLLLLGIVKKNGILQIDYTNKLREKGVPLREAIVRANHVRLRPILMTTFSIVAGLIPTAVGIGAGAAQRSAIAVTIIGGQTLCLLPTLLITPVAYSLFAGLAERRIFQAANAKLARLRMSLARVFTMLFH